MTRVAILVALLAACGGDKGTEGSEGPAGPAGPAGPQGATGPQGPPGQVTVLDGGVLQGPQGPKGDTGDTGPAGPMGATGPMGPMGAMGIAGAMGVAGSAGATGPSGPAGPQGAQGVPGAGGTSGTLIGEAAAVFSGFTTATVIGGSAGGREKMHAACAAQFTGSHLCHAGEYGASNSATTPPAAGAWLDASGAVELFSANIVVVFDLASNDVGRYVGSDFTVNCNNWTAVTSSGTATDGTIIQPAGVTEGLCSVARPLACCSTPYVEKFKGFTTAATTGVVGGRAGMHALCGAQFAGSHMCHQTEYNRATPTTTPPTGGAWIDSSGFVRNAGETQVAFELASSHMGRFLGSDFTINCNNWTAATSGGTATDGAIITTAGETEVLCTTSHPIACCN